MSNCRILMTEAWDTTEQMVRYYGDGKKNGSHIPFNFQLIIETNGNSTAKDFKQNIDAWLTKMPRDVRANWVVCLYSYAITYNNRPFCSLL